MSLDIIVCISVIEYFFLSNQSVFLMKISSKRSDVVVVGGGISGICTAIVAARQKCIVTLLEKESELGGKISSKYQHPIDIRHQIPQVYQRESGIMDELWNLLFRLNTEGTFVGQSRVLKDWLNEEELITCYLDTEVESVEIEKGRIQSVLSKNRSRGDKIVFYGKFFIDCTGIGKVAELSGLRGEKGVDLNELQTRKTEEIRHNIQSTSCLVAIEQGADAYSFTPPKWVGIKWEDNNLAAKVDLMKSLEKSLVGTHRLTWEGPDKTKMIDSDSLAFCAWDYLKNRSPLVKQFENLKLVIISSGTSNTENFHPLGEITLSLEDLAGNNQFDDSVVLGRGSIPESFSKMSSSGDSKQIPQPYELPLRSLFPSDCKNLLLTGSSASATELSSRSLGLTAVSAQSAIAVGFTVAQAISQNRLPRTLAKVGYIEGIQNKLGRSNQLFSRHTLEDDDNLALSCRVNASSYISHWNEANLEKVGEHITDHCLLQFPVTSSVIDRIEIDILLVEKQELTIKIFEGTGFHNALPGYCLHSDEIAVAEDCKCLSIEMNLEIKKTGWHYIEIQSSKKFSVPLFSSGLIGYVLHSKRTESTTKRKYLTDFEPVVTKDPSPSHSPKIIVSPAPSVYGVSNIKNSHFRPNYLPQLWISKPSDFKYPEFVELEWETPHDISQIEISFDSSFDFIYPEKPTSFKKQNFESLVKDYKLYYSDRDKKSVLLQEVFDNQLSFRSHVFDPVKAFGIELEILSTHGLDRAQVFQVRVYP